VWPIACGKSSISISTRLEAVVLAALVATLAVLLTRFRRETLDRDAPPSVATLLRLCGRRSLEIYAVSLFAMQVVAYAIEAGDEDDGAS
jgi:hypothetical protein